MGARRSATPAAAASVVGAGLCLLVWVHARWLGTLPTVYLTLLSLSTALVVWWTVSFQTSGLSGTGRYAAIAWFGAAGQALLVITLTLVHGSPPTPTQAQRDAARFGVEHVFAARVPVLALDHPPRLTDAAGLPAPPAGTTDGVAATGPPVAVPVQKVAVDGRAGKLLVLADTTCRLRGALVGPAEGRPAASVAVLVVAEPTELTGDRLTGPAGRCGPGGLIQSYSVVDVTWPEPGVGRVLDAGAGPAVPVG